MQWIRDGRVAPAAGFSTIRACTWPTGDITAYLASLEPASVDAILLDVDNGPDFLVHQSNSALYGPAH